MEMESLGDSDDVSKLAQFHRMPGFYTAHV
jgi:hypothetical protein